MKSALLTLALAAMLLFSQSSFSQNLNAVWDSFAKLYASKQYEAATEVALSFEPTTDFEKATFSLMVYGAMAEFANAQAKTLAFRTCQDVMASLPADCLDKIKRTEGINYFFVKFYDDLAVAQLMEFRIKEAEACLLTAHDAYAASDALRQNALYSSHLFSMAILYGRLEDNLRAVDLLGELRVWCESRGIKSELYGNALNMMGMIYTRCGMYAQAEECLNAMIILKATHGFDGGYTARMSLANCYLHTGRTAEAKAMTRAVIEEGKRNGAPRREMAVFYRMMGLALTMEENFAEAKHYFQQAFDWVMADNGLNDEWDRLDFIYELCFVKYRTGDLTYGPMLTRLSEVLTDDVLRIFSFLSADERCAYWERRSDMLAKIGSLLYATRDRSLYERVYDNVLFNKGLLLRTENRLSEQLAKPENAHLAPYVQRLRVLQERLAKEPLSESEAEKASSVLERIEKILAVQLFGYQSADEVRKQYGFHSVRESLAQDEAAVEFVKFADLSSGVKEHESFYAAIVIRKGDAAPHIVRLCSAKALDAVLAEPECFEQRRVPKGMVGELYRDYLYGVGQYSFKRLGQLPVTFDCVGDKLFGMLWEPLLPLLQGVRTVFYSTVGRLNALSFSAIPASGMPLASRYDLRLLSSTSMVAAAKTSAESLPAHAVLYGGINYDTPHAELLEQARRYSGASAMQAPRFERDASDRGAVTYLKGSEVEVDGIARLLDAVKVPSLKLSSSMACEESFKALSGNSPALLHVATHGFFLPHVKGQAPTLARVGIVRQPMLRSGLLFSGANQTWQGIAPPEGVDDGILTADEISRLDLRGTDMVVLSACETGLGDEYGSEGIFGLQRAFKLAGARTLIMSLWKVPDAETALLMTTFYRHWLQGVERHEAFRRAQMAVREVKPNPYYWAGFVMMD